MFSLFGGKKNAQFKTVIHPDVGSSLQTAANFPQDTGPDLDKAHGACTRAAVEGTLPAAHFVASVVPDESASAFRVEGVPGQTPLLLANTVVAPRAFEIWEFDPAAARFTRKRAFAMPVEPGDWIARWVEDVACLPAHRLFLSVMYVGGVNQHLAYRYDVAADTLFRVGKLVHFADDFDAYLETRPAGPAAVVLRFDSDVIRLAPENYVNSRSHLLLFSPAHPDGLEVVVLGTDVGSIRRWAVVGKTLWLEVVNPRDPMQTAARVRTLDLSEVL